MLLVGIKAGFIGAVTFLPAIILVVALGYRKRRLELTTAVAAFLFCQMFWLFPAVVGILLGRSLNPLAVPAFEVFSIVLLIYMGFRTLGARRLEHLSNFDEPVSGRQTLVTALTMPARLPLAVALVIATGGHLPNVEILWQDAFVFLVGALIGALFWWGQLWFLAIWVVPSVPEGVTVRSLNKLKAFSGAVYLLLAAVVTLFLYSGIGRS